MKKKHIILVICTIVLLIGSVALLFNHRRHSPTLLDSKIVASLTYANKTDETQAINYYIFKTEYSTVTAVDIVGLNANVFLPLFDPTDAESTTEIMIRNWYGCYYQFPSKCYLCWTVSPNASYALEYDPSMTDHESIIIMANSSVPFEPTK